MCILCLKLGNATVNGKGVVKSTVDWNSDALTKKWQRGSCMVWFVYVFFFLIWRRRSSTNSGLIGAK